MTLSKKSNFYDLRFHWSSKWASNTRTYVVPLMLELTVNSEEQFWKTTHAGSCYHLLKQSKYYLDCPPKRDYPAFYSIICLPGIVWSTFCHAWPRTFTFSFGPCLGVLVVVPHKRSPQWARPLHDQEAKTGTWGTVLQENDPMAWRSPTRHSLLKFPQLPESVVLVFRPLTDGPWEHSKSTQ